MLETLYFGMTMLGVAGITFWSVLAERNPQKYERAWPFAMRDPDDYRRAYRDRLPF